MPACGHKGPSKTLRPRAPLPKRTCHDRRRRPRNATAGIDFAPLDNGFRACDQAERLAAMCDSLSERDIFQFCDRWMRQLPSPFTAAERGRYGYRYSVRQLELSDTRVFDKPRRGPCVV